MAWCRTHNRIITRNYTSCSVKAEERGDCVPVCWGKCGDLTCAYTVTDHIAESRDDWREIVDRAYQEGRIGHKGLEPAVLQALLFSPVYNPRPTGPLPPQGAYPHGNWQ